MDKRKITKLLLILGYVLVVAMFAIVSLKKFQFFESDSRFDIIFPLIKTMGLFVVASYTFILFNKKITEASMGFSSIVVVLSSVITVLINLALFPVFGNSFREFIGGEDMAVFIAVLGVVNLLGMIPIYFVGKIERRKQGLIDDAMKGDEY
jgi:hypothetical protein